MSRKRVLVVDDSKSARVILSRMLEKYDIEVDMAESAEHAIEYLAHNRPDAIFMDHLMPGMDGLQAVQAIKSNPQTAMIPIMMYTSQEGELYVGQARALGAMGVLPKQVRPVDVSKVLYELHLLPDRRDIAEAALAPVEIESGIPFEKKVTPLPGPAIDWGKRVESAVKDQAVDIRRFIVASLDSFASRIVSDVKDVLPPPVDFIAPPPPPKPSALPWVLGLSAALILAGGFGTAWFLTRNDLIKSRAELNSLSNANSDLERARGDLTATVKDLTAALQAVNAGGAPGVSGNPSSLSPNGTTRFEPVPYGEIPFDRSRLDVLREFLSRLETQQFHGIVHITNTTGTYCLTGNPIDGYVLAASSLPIAKCDVIGNPFDESLSGQQRESLAFANLIAGVRQRSGGAIQVSMDPPTIGKGPTPYPPRTDGLTAGEWNRAAAANNRVEFSAEAGATGAVN
ncbi:MAG TPA: response regulator [Steroidobacteraceae bacterium]|jgi:CheY-like chemotaxis protein